MKHGLKFDLKAPLFGIKHGIPFLWAFTGTLLVISSVAEASDLQIYAVPTAGKKTIIMMLDTSGSMGYTAGSGYALTDDYNVCTGTSSITTGTYTNNKLYSVTSSTTPTYARNFCYVSASAAASNSKVTNTTTGCEKQSDGSYRCFDRLTRLKDGMFAFLDSSNSTLNNARVGMGHFSAYNSGTTTGDGSSGEIMVAAKALGAVGSAQRVAIKTAVAGLASSKATPTAHAYAEAAAYLMGTSTYSETYTYRSIAVEKYRLVRKYTTVYSSSRYNYTYTYALSACTAWNSTTFGSTNAQTCSTWGTAVNTTGTSTNTSSSTTPVWSSQPTVTYDSTNPTSPSNNPGNGTSQTIIYRQNESQLYQTTPDANSGMPKSKSRDTIFNPDIVMDRTATDVNALYKSPLPAVTDRVSCDGQGVYILSDGAANSSSDAEATAVMSQSLGSYGSGFSCSGGLTDATTVTGGMWNCMSTYAKKLFDSTKNPAGVKIQTAFVGFGSAMSSLTDDYVLRACQLTSRTQSDRSGDDSCSPNQATYGVASPGYGNGGFFPTQSSQGVTDSVVAFINNLGVTPLEPLTTGSISVPSDSLKSNGLQPYGYLRAMEPNPQTANLVWTGNLKKYQVVQTGTNAGAFAAKDGSTLVYNSTGQFNANTQDLWNTSAYNDGKVITLGGAYSKVAMPVTGQAENLAVSPKQYLYAGAPDALRTLFTDVAAGSGATLAAAANGASLLRIPEGTVPTSGVAAYVLGKFNPLSGQTTLKDFPLLAKQKLLNYLGYSVPLDATATALLTSLTIPAAPNLSLGASIHSVPVQLTYSGTLDDDGQLTSTREQSVLYGSMEGGLHLVDESTGVEQMVFVPSELLRDTVASKAIVKGQEDTAAPAAGMDGAWVADAAYNVNSDGTKVVARQMNVYGGLRMGGSSYYALDLLNKTQPKLLFRVGPDLADFTRMGQSWSKPVIANIRYNGAIKRVMIVGGGYDTCYETPDITLSNACFSGSKAKGNAVYIIDAKTGARLWWASDSGADTNNSNMKHSIVSRISAIDRNADGLIDNLYFGDLGGQVFRADLNNNQTLSGSTYSSFGVRVTRLANLATDAAGAALTLGKNPRFYEAPTITIHDQGAYTFALVGIASGNRSTPLDVYPIVGRDGMSPSTALTDRLVNNVYGIIDRDFIKGNLITGSPTLDTQDKTLQDMQKNPQTLASGTVVSTFFNGTTGTGKAGWYRSLSSNSAGTERADNSFRITGGMKAFEEPIALTGNLIVPVYDPQGNGISTQNPCLPRVVGETDRQLFCLPFGACLNADGTPNTTQEIKTGFRTKTGTTNCPDSQSECNTDVLGGGIVGVALVPVKNNSTGTCGTSTLAGNTAGSGEWQCVRKFNPTRWYEKYVTAN